MEMSLSVVNGIKQHSCIVLDGIRWYLMVFNGIEFAWMVFIDFLLFHQVINGITRLMDGMTQSIHGITRLIYGLGARPWPRAAARHPPPPWS